MNGLDDLIKKLDRIENHLGEEIAPSVNNLLKESVSRSLIDWYNDYEPEEYKRTYNFMRIVDNTHTRAKGNIITMSIDSGSMNSYKGFDRPPYKGYEKKTLQPSAAFDFFFIGGEHGHGNWMMHQSLPPYMYVESDIYDGFGGRINKVVDGAIERILRK